MLMGRFNNQTFKSFFSLTFLLFLLIISSINAFPSSSHGIQPKIPSKEPTTRYPVLCIKKNTAPLFLDRAAPRSKNEYGRKRKMVVKTRKKKKKMMMMIKNFKDMPFSSMLPKGFVPPSGSSPCHNQQTNSISVTSYCDLSAAQPEIEP